MIDQAQKEIVEVINPGDPYEHHNDFKYELKSGFMFSSRANSIGVSPMSGDNMAVVLLNGKDMSFSKPGLPNNIAKIFLTGDLVTFVYHDGKVEMKPANCLGKSEQGLVKQVRADVEGLQGKLQSSGSQHVDQQMENPNQQMQDMNERQGLNQNPDMFGGSSMNFSPPSQMQNGQFQQLKAEVDRMQKQMENLNQQMQDMKAQLQMIIGVPSQNSNMFQGPSPSYGLNPRPMNNYGLDPRGIPHVPNFQSRPYSGDGARMYGPSDSDDEYIF